MSQQHRYIVDFFNIFSDFREIKYKKLGIDFHSCKYDRIKEDTLEFFDVFFTKYTSKVQIDLQTSEFIFVMKKLNGYHDFLCAVLKKYSDINVQFVIVEKKYDNALIDRNKDDFLCQYLLYSIGQKYPCSLISNDRYRDRSSYIDLFTFGLSLVVMTEEDTCIKTQNLTLNVPNISQIKPDLLSQTYKRCSIPKQRLDSIVG
jgi:hypothetical protein